MTLILKQKEYDISFKNLSIQFFLLLQKIVIN